MKRCKCPAKDDVAITVVHALQAAKMSKSPIDRDATEALASWYINSPEHNYCFWELNKELHNSPLSDKEIANLLVMSKEELEATYASAIAKLTARKDTPEVQAFLEAVQDRINTSADGENNSVYMPSNFREKISAMDAETTEEQNEEEKKKPGRGRPKKKMNALPSHRDGRKKDLWGLSSSYKIRK